MREVALNCPDIAGRKVIYNKREVGHIVRVEGNSIICAIDDDTIARKIKDCKTAFSLEVVKR